LEKLNKIDEICQQLGVNQKKLAEMMGITQNSISNWKYNRQQIPNWALKMFNLLLIEKEHIELTRTLSKYRI
jgi:DNA-binding transcriptional regulator YiaG